MRVVIQRVSYGKVTVENEVIGSIGKGIVALVGITHEDTEQDADWTAEKIANLRIFEDEGGKMNRSLLDQNGEVLSVSQFTLYGDCKKGRRPNFMSAAKPDHAVTIYEHFNDSLREKGIKVETGEFGAMMDVELNNDGPVTLIIENP
ncbi:D-aminoacyl-tRNA deacylase [Thalassorhabdus alkalitolerans]|uniref:D-aminoacyl-tRNA deacylase n=1 Tax=Thalassorhabdus alkalitolerans TaxID=2282697 RepID=A0ABW0YT29_9BACI|nr:D-aminoacyl-tRNA deacylase [Thalassobacillus sp. C254]